MSRGPCFWFLLATTLPAAESTPIPLDRILTHIAQRISRIPHYTCIETVKRSRTGEQCADCEISDRFRVEVLVAGKREVVTWPGESSFDSTTVGQLVSSGTTVAGQFAGFASGVFLDGQASHFYRGEQLLEGRRVLRYEYEFTTQQSDFRVTVDGLSTAVNYRGAWFIDPLTLDLVRLTVAAERIPGWLGLVHAESVIDYGRLLMGPTTFLLPQAAVSITRYASGTVHTNTTRYDGCRQYAATSTIRFGPPEQLATVARAERSGDARQSLFAPLELDTRLDYDLDLKDLAVGDPIRLSLAQEVMHGDLRFPRGARLQGRITRLEVLKASGKGATTVFAFRPLFLEINGTRTPVRLNLTGVRLRRGTAGIFRSDGAEGVLLFDSHAPWILKYSHFQWRTLAPTAP